MAAFLKSILEPERLLGRVKWVNWPAEDSWLMFIDDTQNTLQVFRPGAPIIIKITQICPLGGRRSTIPCMGKPLLGFLNIVQPAILMGKVTCYPIRTIGTVVIDDYNINTWVANFSYLLNELLQTFQQQTVTIICTD